MVAEATLVLLYQTFPVPNSTSMRLMSPSISKINRLIFPANVFVSPGIRSWRPKSSDPLPAASVL